MNLIAIKEYMMKVRITSLSTLCHVFNADADTMRCRLSHWIRKGKIKQCVKTQACGIKCFKCQIVTTELYEWLDSTALSS